MLNRSASLAMSTSILKALPGKLDIKRHSPSILYIYVCSYVKLYMQALLLCIVECASFASLYICTCDYAYLASFASLNGCTCCFASLYSCTCEFGIAVKLFIQICCSVELCMQTFFCIVVSGSVASLYRCTC